MWLWMVACVSKSPSESAAGPDDTGAPVHDSGDSGDSGDPPDDSADSGDSGAQDGAILYVSGYFSGKVHRYDAATGAALSPIEGVPGAQTVVLHEGQLVIVAELDNAVRLADPATGALTGTLIADDPATEADETGGLDGPTAAIPGPDGLWYVASFNTDAVLRYDAAGTYVDTFVATGADGLDGPDIGIAFDAAGDLYVPGWYSNTVHVFGPDGAAGTPLLTADDGLESARMVVFDNERAWVTSAGNGTVFRIEGGVATEFARMRQPTGLALWQGAALVSSAGNDTVQAFDAETGEELGARVDDDAIDGVTTVAVY